MVLKHPLYLVRGTSTSGRQPDLYTHPDRLAEHIAIFVCVHASWHLSSDRFRICIACYQTKMHINFGHGVPANLSRYEAVYVARVNKFHAVVETDYSDV